MPLRPAVVHLPNLTVHQLQYLAAVADAPRWADAADAIGVTPSALSQGLAELERRVGITLFERDGRRRVLAPAASPVLDHARRVLASTADLTRWAAGVRDAEHGSLRIGMIDTAAVDHFADVLRRFRAERPAVDLHLTVQPSGALLRDLSRATLDLVVCVRPPTSVDGIGLDPLLDDPLYVYAPDHTPARTPPSDWGPWVGFPTGSHTRAVIGELLGSLGVRYDVTAESNQPDVLREMVRLGLGWTVLPRQHGATPFRATPVGSRELVLATRIDAAPNPAAQAMAVRLRPRATGGD